MTSKWGRHKHARIISRNKQVNLEAQFEKIVLEEQAPSMAPVSPLPWNLRSRNGTVALKIEEINKAIEEEDEEKKKIKRSSRLKSKMAKEEAAPMMLSKLEILEDFLKMTGEKPPSRPKRRTKAAQRGVDPLYIGKCLEEIPADRYNVHESPSSIKKVERKKKA